jgi:AsmA protein
MRRYSIVIVASLAAVLAALFIATSFAVSTPLVKDEIAQRLNTLTGGSVTLHGEPVVTVFPSISVEVKDVVVAGAGDRDHPLATVAALKASLRIVPLLVGRVEVETLTLVSPRIHLILNESGAGNWEADRIPTAASALGQSSGSRLGEIVLQDGRLLYEDRHTGQMDAISAANLRLAWPHATEAAELSGTFAWRGEMVDVRAGLDTPGAVFGEAGSDGHLTLAAVSALHTMDSDTPAGSALESAPPHSPLRRFAEWLGISIAPGASFGPLHIVGNVAADETSVKLSEATFELDGNAAEGNLALRLEGDRPSLQGSLAFDAFDLSPYAEKFLPSKSRLLTLPISADWLSYADVDIRASADQIDLVSSLLTDISIALSMRRGRMTLSLDRADLADGHMEGQMTAEPAKQGIKAGLSARLKNVSVADAGWSFWTAHASRLIGADIPLLGTGSAMLNLSGEGTTADTIVRSFSGNVGANLQDGVVVGVDIVSTLEDIFDGNTVIPNANYPFLPAIGRTYFSALTARVAVEAGIPRVEKIQLDGDRFAIELSGQGDLKRGEIEAEGIASLFDGERTANSNDHPVVELPFGIGGTLWEPMVAPGIPRIKDRSASAALPQRSTSAMVLGDEDRSRCFSSSKSDAPEVLCDVGIVAGPTPRSGSSR